jgi:VanZ family protein
VLLWCAVIFTASTSHFSAAATSRWIEPLLRGLFPGASLMAIQTMHFLVRKAAHFTEYGILFLLLARGPLRGRPILALAICACYALTDEAHQIWVPLRGPSLYDVALDFSGALFSNFMHQSVLELV